MHTLLRPIACLALSATFAPLPWQGERAAETWAETCDELAGRHALSGVMLVARGDEVLAERAYGCADLEGHVPIASETRFLVASLTKPVVAFLTLRLAELGVLNLEDRAGAHIEELRDTAAGRATVHQLLTHTSGLPHYEGWPGFLDARADALGEADLIARLARTELGGEPGEAFDYSGPGYLLLGLVLERAAGEPLPALLAKHVLDPLGMTSSSLLGAEGVAPAYARPLVRDGEHLGPAPVRHPSTLRAAGGLVTTARDLHRFVRAVQQGQLLGEASHATLLRVAKGRYACGLIVYDEPWTRRRMARHMGSMDGVAAHFVFGLDDDRICITLANVAPTAVDDLDDALMAKLWATTSSGEPR